MLEIPVVRWGKEYESMSKMDVVHFETGETLARVHEANAGLIKMDMKKAKKAREILRQFSIQELVDKCAVAGELVYRVLPAYDGDIAECRSLDAVVDRAAARERLSHDQHGEDAFVSVSHAARF